MKHYSKEELELYRNNQMSVLGKIACLNHLRQCSACMNRLDMLETEDRLIEELRASVNLFPNSPDSGRIDASESGRP